MKKIFKGLAALAICGALNFGLTTDAQAAEIDLINSSGTEYQELYGPPPPPPPPPPRYYDDFPPPPPPPPRHHHHGPPPPPPPHHHGW